VPQSTIGPFPPTPHGTSSSDGQRERPATTDVDEFLPGDRRVVPQSFWFVRCMHAVVADAATDPPTVQLSFRSDRGGVGSWNISNTKTFIFFGKQRFILMETMIYLYETKFKMNKKEKKKCHQSLWNQDYDETRVMQYSPKLSDPQETSTIKIGVRVLPPSLLKISKIEKHVSIDPTRPCNYT
jgi:hypothetical protein